MSKEKHNHCVPIFYISNIYGRSNFIENVFLLRGKTCGRFQLNQQDEKAVYTERIVQTKMQYKAHLRFLLYYKSDKIKI